MRAELLRLTELLESLETAAVPLVLADSGEWLTLVEQVRSAARKSELRRAEDQVDAVVCAYVGLFSERRPEATTVYGDLETGYIVTPALPADLRPGAADVRPAAAATGHAERVRAAVRAFAEDRPRLMSVTDAYVSLVTTLLDDAGINYLSVSGRTKTVASFAAKAARTHEGLPIYADPLHDITDVVGVRVITYLHSDVTAVATLLSDQFEVLDDRDMGQETASEGRFGYASRHLLVAVDGSRPSTPAYDALAGRAAQVQVRTVLQHAWAEFEHAIRYKGTIPEEHVPDLDRRFTLAAGLLELADREFSMIRDRLQATVPGQPADGDVSDPRIGGQDLATFLANQYADAGWSRPDHYEWVAGLMLELGITSLEELAALLATVDSESLHARMGYRYPAGAVRRLDDALLWLFGARYVGLHGNAHRVLLLEARLERLRGQDEG
jgi:ppGpp synthetase/RelA/SpoT-type nucleotidyltranferase